MDYSYYSAPQSQSYSLYGLHGLPTPEQTSNSSHTDTDIQETLASLEQNYQTFDPCYQNPAAASGTGAYVPPPHSPPESFSKHSVSSSEVANQHEAAPSADGGDDLMGESGMGMGRSSSEEKEGGNMTPAQTKRKAQNRAAQRAFRERKERHVRELEEKVNSLQQESSTLMADNERLKQELAKFTTENEILRATSQSFHHAQQPGAVEAPPTTTGPLKYSPTDFTAKLVPEGEPVRRHRVTICEKTGEKLLDAGATWDLIQGHELFKQGLVDIGDVSDRLKGLAQCDGQGPAFRADQVRKAIEESAASTRDELI